MNPDEEDSVLGFGSACRIGAGPPTSPPHRDVHFAIEDNGQNWPIESEVHVSMRRTRPWQALGSGGSPLLIDHDDEFEAGGCSVLLQKVRHVDFDRGFRDGEGCSYISIGQAVAQQVQDFLLRLGQV